MDVAGFRKAGREAVEKIAKYYESMDSGSLPVTMSIKPGDLRKSISDKPPKKGERFEDIDADFERLLLPGCTHWQHPGFFGFFPANSCFESIIADMYSTAIGNPGFNWECAPIASDLEFIVMDWVADLLGLDEAYTSHSATGGGIIMGTSSEACLTICVAARERALSFFENSSSIHLGLINGETHAQSGQKKNYTAGRQQQVSELTKVTSNLVMYGTSETHSMGSKAAKVLGFRWKPLPVSAEDGWRLRGETLKKALEEDIANSLIPCILVVSLGATNFGGKDCIDELTLVAENYPSLWVHVDAAWAGSYLGLEECREELYLSTINQGSEGDRVPRKDPWDQKFCSQQPPGLVHSFCTNLHKSGLVGFECTTLFVRNKYLIINAIQQGQPCLESSTGHSDPALDIRNWEIPLGRRFRSLKVYFVLRSFGVEGYQQELRRTIEVTAYLEKLIKSCSWFHLMAPRVLALVAFRMNPDPGYSDSRGFEEQSNILSRELAKRLEATHEISLTSAAVDGKFCLRIAVGRMTHMRHMEKIWNLLTNCAREVLSDAKTLPTVSHKEL